MSEKITIPIFGSPGPEPIANNMEKLTIESTINILRNKIEELAKQGKSQLCIEKLNKYRLEWLNKERFIVEKTTPSLLTPRVWNEECTGTVLKIPAQFYTIFWGPSDA